MKKLSLILSAIALIAGVITAQRQTVTVTKTNGEKVRFYASDVDKIQFGYENDNQGGGLSEDDAVDLGLSVKWASCNLGATVPEGFGDYYAWGETSPKEIYSEETYQHFDSEWGYRNLGYNITETPYDAAHVNLGEGWRMPTQLEWQELCSKCKWQWSSVNGVNGYTVTASNGNSIFLPAAGRKYDAETEPEQNGRENIGGYYWESTVLEHDDYNYRCNRVSFENSGYFYDGGDVPFIGMSIRPVYGALVDTDPEPEPGPMDMVDLGLSVKWASHNVGAARDTEIGNFYSWGVNRVQDSYGDPAYKYNEGEAYDEKGVKYNIYTDIGQNISGTKYDVATVRWGEGWRMPSRAECQELIDKCTWTYKSGRGWTITGPNGNSIFLPIGGFAGVEGVTCDTPNDIFGVPFLGYYATGEEKETVLYPYPTSRYCLKIGEPKSTYLPKVDDTFKSLGVNVRPVHD